jgi:hypothetical protein
MEIKNDEEKDTNPSLDYYGVDHRAFVDWLLYERTGTNSAWHRRNNTSGRYPDSPKEI